MLADTQKPMLGTTLNRSHPLADGLVGCWLFNEGVGNVAYDTSGYGNHGTLLNMAAPSTTASGWNPGRRGPSIAFDGSNDYINCGTKPSLTIIYPITLEAWVKKNTDLQLGIINKHDYRLFLCGASSGRIVFWVGGSNWDDYLLSISGVFPKDTWTHIVATYDDPTAKVYVNGVDVGTATKPGRSASSATPLYVGSYGGSSLDFNGSIDQVRIYNRALSADEITWLYRVPYAMFERGELLL